MLQSLIVLNMFLRSRPLIQQAQVRLPPDRNHAAEDASVLDRDVCEAKRGDHGPHFPAVDPASRHSVSDALYNFVEGGACEEGLHAEEVRVEDGCEEQLVDDDLSDGLVSSISGGSVQSATYLGRQTQDLGRVVEVHAQPQKPPVTRYTTDSSNGQRSPCARPVAVFTPLLNPSSFIVFFYDVLLLWSSDTLRDQVAYKVNHQRAHKLRHIWFPLLDTAVSAEGFNDGFEPEPTGPGYRRDSSRCFLTWRRFCCIAPTYYMRWRCSLCEKVELRGISGSMVGVPRISVCVLCCAP